MSDFTSASQSVSLTTSYGNDNCTTANIDVDEYLTTYLASLAWYRRLIKVRDYGGTSGLRHDNFSARYCSVQD